jgi:hypothetical protein
MKIKSTTRINVVVPTTQYGNVNLGAECEVERDLTLLDEDAQLELDNFTRKHVFKNLVKQRKVLDELDKTFFRKD